MIFDSFNNRDWSLFIWTTLFFGFMLWIGRTSLPGLIKSFFNKHILSMILLMFLYVYISVYLLYKVNLWNASMMKDAVLWTIGVAFPMFFKAVEASKGKYRLRDTLIDNLKLTVFVEFIVNLYVFNFWVELLFIPFVTLLTVLMAVAEKKEEYKVVYKFFNYISSIIGMILLYHAVKYIITDFRGFATFNNLESFLFPIAMAALYMPFIYLIALYMAYEEFFVRIRIAHRHDRAMARYAKWQIIKKGKLSLKTVIAVAKKLRIYELQSKQDLVVALKDIKCGN